MSMNKPCSPEKHAHQHLFKKWERVYQQNTSRLKISIQLNLSPIFPKMTQEINKQVSDLQTNSTHVGET